MHPAYVGAKGTHLLANQVYLEPGTGTLRRRIAVTQGSSNYHALRLRYSGSIRPRFYPYTSYTHQHARCEHETLVRLSILSQGSVFNTDQRLTQRTLYRKVRPSTRRIWRRGMDGCTPGSMSQASLFTYKCFASARASRRSW